MNNDGLASLDAQGVIDTLERCESGGRYRSSMPKVKRLRYWRDVFRRHCHILGVKPPFPVEEAVGIDAIPFLESPDPRAYDRNRA
jgi:hypothetical protein